MKFSVLGTRTPSIVIIHSLGTKRTYDRVENDFRIRSIFAKQESDLLHGLQVLLNYFAGSTNDLFLLDLRLGNILKDSAQNGMRLNGEDAGIQNVSLVTDVVAYYIFA